MDRIVKHFDFVEDDDLNICEHRGIAYQNNVKRLVNYDQDYIEKYISYEGTEIANKLNEGRVNFVKKYLERIPFKGEQEPVLDIGIGSGEFIKARKNTYGTDVNEAAKQWLMRNNLYNSDMDDFNAFTFWDVIEHVPEPNNYFKRIQRGSMLFTSIPIFKDLSKIRESKHYKPNEHLYYFTEQGFIDYMQMYQFKCEEVSDFETRAGREDIKSFAMKKKLPDYHSTLDQYGIIHSKSYGHSAHLYFHKIADIVLKENPNSILDYGCGRSDLLAHFWNEGKRRLYKYDPAIPEYKHKPVGSVDLVLCSDVMEHILIYDIDRVLKEIKEKSNKVIFTISLQPARAKLPDGRNAHVTLMHKTEWLNWINSIFGKAKCYNSGIDNIILVTTF